MTAVGGQGLAAFELDGQDQRQVVELQVSAGSSMRGRTIGEVTTYREAVPLAHLPQEGPERFLLDVDLETRLQAGDRLVLCAPPRSLASLLSEMDDADAPHLLWAALAAPHGPRYPPHAG